MSRLTPRQAPGPFVALLLLVITCSAGCRGVEGRGDGWLRDAEWTGAETPACTPWAASAMTVQTSSDSSPLGAILSGILPKKEERFSHRPRVEPVPIVGEGEIGMSFTVHW